MAKKVKLGLEGLKVNETECKLLACLVQTSRAQHRIGCEYVALSRKEIAQLIGCSSLTVIRTCQKLEGDRLIEIRSEHLDNGAQMANSYRVTALGLEVSRLYREHVAETEDISA